MSTGRGDADFSKRTSDILARRAGFRCSFESCPIVTVGPGDADDEAASVGTAAHINSASLDGPRGRGNLTDAQLASVSNGIWCCANHGREIDTNAGRGFSVEKLQAWKAIREAEARRERSGLSKNVGWVTSVTVNRSPLFRANSKLILDKALFIEGGSVGKSSLLEWLAGAGGNNSMMRWAKRQAEAEFVRLTINYNSTEPRELEFEFDRVTPSYRLGGKAAYSAPSDLSIILLKEEPRRRVEGHDDLQLIAHALSTTVQQVRAILPDVERSGSGQFEMLHFEEAELDEENQREEPYDELLLQRQEAGFEQSMASLSGSELGLLLVDFACALARAKAGTTTTLLLLDAGSLPFTPETLRSLADWLVMQRFQTLMIVTDWQIVKDRSRNWSVVKFEEGGGAQRRTVIV